MSNYQATSLRRLVSGEKFEQLCCLWEQQAEETGTKVVTEALFSAKNSNKGSGERLRLLLVPKMSALLVGSPLAHSDYQITIVFSPQAIADYLSSRQPLDSSLQKRLQQTQQLRSEFSNFTLQLLEILTPQQSVEDIDQHQLEQRILEQLAFQVSQNWDDSTIINMTLESVRKLLQVDRLVVYQLNVLMEAEQQVDTVTHEALADACVPSILHFHDEICLRDTPERLEKYRHGFTLAVNDVQNSQIGDCLRSLMQQLQVRAMLVIPVVVGGELWGFLIAHQCFAPRQWQNERMFLLQIAQYLAIAIGKTRLARQVQQHRLEQVQRTQAVQNTDRLKSEFIGNISHEFRTPLTHIIGLSGTLLHWSKQKLPLPADKQHHYLELIQNSGRHLLALIDNILDFSQVKEGKTPLHLSEFSLLDLCHSVLNQIKEAAECQDICLKLDFRVELNSDRCWADRERVQQILLHLLDNAIKFTPAGKTVTLKVWRDEQTVFQIEDTGIGVSQEQLPLLFEMFQQLEHSRQRTHNGTGLGLALTKQLIELHQGTIQVESIPEQGSLFTVRLPI